MGSERIEEVRCGILWEGWLCGVKGRERRDKAPIAQ